MMEEGLHHRKERFYGFTFSYEALLRRILLDCHEAYMNEDVERLNRCVLSLIANLPVEKIKVDGQDIEIREYALSVYESVYESLRGYKPRSHVVADQVSEDKETRLGALLEVLSHVVWALDKAKLLRKEVSRQHDIGVSRE